MSMKPTKLSKSVILNILLARIHWIVPTVTVFLISSKKKKLYVSVTQYTYLLYILYILYTGKHYRVIYELYKRLK